MLTEKPRAIIFDWDDTLADTRDIFITAIDAILSKFGKPSWETTKKKRDNTLSARDNFPHFFDAEHAAEAYSLYLAEYRRIMCSILKPKHFAKELLEIISASSVTPLIISNKELSLLEEEVKILFPAINFHGVHGAGSAARCKPHPDPVWKAFENGEMHPHKDRIWFVGDSTYDTDCALATGCVPILVGAGKSLPEGYLAQNPAVIHVPSLEVLSLSL